MDTNTTNNETNEQGTVSVTIRMDATVHEAVKQVADSEDRSLTKQIERILKQSPEISQRLQGVGAGA